MKKTRKKTIRIIAIVSIIISVIVSSVILALIFLPYYYSEPEIIVIRPDSSDVCDCLGSYKIRWNASESITKVRIELYNGSEYVEDVNERTNNDGEYTWTISKDHFFTNGTQYRIKISDHNNENIYDYSDYFGINIDYSNGGNGG